MTRTHNLTGYIYTRPIKNIKKFTMGNSSIKKCALVAYKLVFCAPIQSFNSFFPHHRSTLVLTLLLYMGTSEHDSQAVLISDYTPFLSARRSRSTQRQTLIHLKSLCAICLNMNLNAQCRDSN